MNPKLQKWTGWMKVIHDEVQALMVAKRTHHEVAEIVAKNSALQQSNPFYGHLGSTYTSHVVMGLRRQLKTGRDQISMANLFSEMINSPDAITRKHFVSKYAGTVVERSADRDFDKFAVPSALHIDAGLVSEDLKSLKEATAHCEEFADRRVAHRDSRLPRQVPTYNELDAAIDRLDQLYVKYHLLFRATSMDTLLPTRQYDWQEVFRVPWIPSG